MDLEMSERRDDNPTGETEAVAGAKKQNAVPYALTREQYLLNQLEEMSKTLEEERKRLSVQAFLEIHKGLPRLEVNRDAIPSATNDYNSKSSPHDVEKAHGSNSNKRCISTADGYQKSEEERQTKKPSSRHEIASWSSLSPDFAIAIEKRAKNFHDPNGDLIKSTVATYIGTEWKKEGICLSNFNEASPAFWVHLIIRDALKCLGIEENTEVGMEVSIGCLRPDILVVRHRAQIILVVEVKNPGTKAAEVMRMGTALGQQYDYAMLLRQMGIDVPFVVLTTYSHLQIGTLQPDVSETLDSALERLQDGNGKIEGIEPSNKEKPNVSPQKARQHCFELPDDSVALSESSDEDDEGGDQIASDEGDGDDKKRMIYITETFDLSKLFDALCLTIVCGIVAAETTEGKEKAVIPKEGDAFEGEYARVRGQDAFTFTRHTAKRATYALKTRWQCNQILYLHVVLGMGNVGKVHLTSDTSGKLFASKLYPYDSRVMESYSGKTNQKTREDQRKKLEEMRDKEAETWKALYPVYAKAVHAGQLLDMPCLMMPYVASIPKERRRELIGAVESELKRAATATAKRCAYVYKESDLRWRHFGLRTGLEGNEQIVLVDLGSMISLEKEDDGMDRVKWQLKKLWHRATEEEVPIPHGLIGGIPTQDYDE